MKNWYAIFNMIAVVMCVLFIYSMNTQMQAYEEDFDNQVLAIATDYASIGAIDSSLAYGSIGTSYLDMDTIAMNPENTLQTFKAIMCSCYNISTSETALKTIEDSIGAMILVGWDGYYIVEQHDGGLKFSLKKPFAFDMSKETGGLNRNFTLSFAINSERVTVIENNPTSRTSYQCGSYEELGNLMRNLGSTAFDAKVLSKFRHVEIANLLNSELVRSAENLRNERERDYRIYIPATSSEDGINTIDGPTLLSINVGSGSYSRYANNTDITMAAYKIIAKVYTIGFVENGIKYYCYEKQLPESLKNSDLKYFSSPYEAAKDGYLPHLAYLGRDIDIEY